MANSKIYLSKRFKQLREERGISQAEFADLSLLVLGETLSISSVQSLEQGRRALKPELLLEIARYFKVNPNELAVRK
jgi:transcriptional regulator with XRE-family HTH domain